MGVRRGGRGEKGNPNTQPNTTLQLNTKLLTYDIKVPKMVSNKIRKFGYNDKVALQVIVTNLISCYRKGSKLVYSRNKSHVSVGKRKLGSRKIIKAVEWLDSCQYVESFLGTAHVRKENRNMSYIQPTEKFIDEFCQDEKIVLETESCYLESQQVIELRDDTKKSVGFRYTDAIREMEIQVRATNEINSRATVRDYQGVLLSNFYCRIFNRDFDHGGRFYRADVLQLKSSSNNNRLGITINGNSVVEVDYTNLHLRIIAIWCDFDELDMSDDLYTLVLMGTEYESLERAIIKTTVNILLNSTSKKAAVGAVARVLEKSNTNVPVTAKKLVQLVYEALPQVAPFFCNEQSYGGVLQKEDSMLAAKVLKVFADKGYPCLPVHDSFLVEQKHGDLLMQTMADVFKDQLNYRGPVPLGVEELGNGKYQILL